MEYLWRILRLLDWLYYWRFNLCLWTGVVLAFLALAFIPWQIPSWIAAGLLFLTMFYLGARWQARGNRC